MPSGRSLSIFLDSGETENGSDSPLPDLCASIPFLQPSSGAWNKESNNLNQIQGLYQKWADDSENQWYSSTSLLPSLPSSLSSMVSLKQLSALTANRINNPVQKAPSPPLTASLRRNVNSSKNNNFKRRLMSVFVFFLVEPKNRRRLLVFPIIFMLVVFALVYAQQQQQQLYTESPLISSSSWLSDRSGINADPYQNAKSDGQQIGIDEQQAKGNRQQISNDAQQIGALEHQLNGSSRGDWDPERRRKWWGRFMTSSLAKNNHSNSSTSVSSVSENTAIKQQYNRKGLRNARQDAVRNATRHAWDGYRRYAWGRDQLRPVSRTAAPEWFECGLTILDSLDTLLIMDLDEEYQQARQWVSTELSFNKDRYVSLFEITIRALGGLLGAFHLSGGDRLFLDRAEELGRRLLPALRDKTLIVPYSDINLATGAVRQAGWTSGDSSLSEVASLQLEFRELGRLLGDPEFERAAFRISEHIHRSGGCASFGGLCPMFISPSDGQFNDQSTITFGARADSYYEYLLKQWLQTGKSLDWLSDDYRQAMGSMRDRLWRLSEPSKFGFVGELTNGGMQFVPKMDHLACFLAGTLALGYQQGGMPDFHLELAKNLSNTCHQMYAVTATRLGPEIAYFNMVPDGGQDITIRPLDSHSLLRPEAIEAWFYMYRVTGDSIYQDWGWQAFQAIERYARIPSGGYSSVNDVKMTSVTYRDSMESFVISETFKYLYLLFDDGDQSVDENCIYDTGATLPPNGVSTTSIGPEVENTTSIIGILNRTRTAGVGTVAAGIAKIGTPTRMEYVTGTTSIGTGMDTSEIGNGTTLATVTTIETDTGTEGIGTRTSRIFYADTLSSSSTLLAQPTITALCSKRLHPKQRLPLPPSAFQIPLDRYVFNTEAHPLPIHSS